MGKTKMTKVYFPGWQLWIFSITLDLLVLVIQPRFTLAQTPTNPANAQKVANTTELADLEPKILSEINRVRTSPQDYARWLEQQRQYYDGIWLRLPGEKPVRTNRGRDALEEAIAFLKQQKPLPPLEKSSQTAAAATSELENFANSNNIQYFSYGKKTASGIVMDLVVDELFPDRRRRQSLLSPEAEDTGVACKPDPRYAKVCAIAYSDSPNHADVATVEPKTPTPPEKTVATVEPKTPAPPEKTVATVEPEVILPGISVSEPKAESPAPDNKPTADETKQTEQVKQAEAETNDAALPIPRSPQAPPAPTVSNDPEPSPETNPQPTPEAKTNPEDVQIAQAESEIEQEKKLAESNPPKEVAINSETADSSEKVEKGALEQGDRVIKDDGSLYDFYPIQGKAGESVTIHLESDKFDAFVALVDSNGKTVGENDDISPEDSNSELKVTIPEDGIYNVIVNTYDENGTGEYVLKVSR